MSSETEKELTDDQLIKLGRVGDYPAGSVPERPDLPDGWVWDPEIEAVYLNDGPAIFVYADPKKMIEARIDIVERAHKVDAAYKALLREEKDSTC